VGTGRLLENVLETPQLLVASSRNKISTSSAVLGGFAMIKELDFLTLLETIGDHGKHAGNTHACLGNCGKLTGDTGRTV
jgi:hypothetical protein